MDSKNKNLTEIDDEKLSEADEFILKHQGKCQCGGTLKKTSAIGMY